MRLRGHAGALEEAILPGGAERECMRWPPCARTSTDRSGVRRRGRGNLQKRTGRLTWERSAIAAQSEEREPDTRTRRPSKSSASRDAYGRSHECGGQRRREGERETMREKSTSELAPERLKTVSDKIRCGITLSASPTTSWPGLSSLSASDRSRLPSTPLAMSVCLQSRPFKQLLLNHPVAISPTVMTPCNFNVVLHPRTLVGFRTWTVSLQALMSSPDGSHVLLQLEARRILFGS